MLRRGSTIGNRVAVDRTANKVMGGGIHYHPKKRLRQKLWKNPPPTIPPPNELIKRYIGQRQNLMTIIGCLRDRPKKGKKRKGFSLLARCACGKYEVRSSLNWGRCKSFNDACQHCRHLRYLRRLGDSNEERDRKDARLKAAHEKWVKENGYITSAREKVKMSQTKIH